MADVQACEYEEIGGDWRVVSEDGRRVSEWMSKLGLMQTRMRRLRSNWSDWPS
jgi:hypothetical protein